jgi:hypothetical protein
VKVEVRDGAVDVTPGRCVVATARGIQVVGLEENPLTADDAEELAETVKRLAVFQRALRS